MKLSESEKTKAEQALRTVLSRYENAGLRAMVEAKRTNSVVRHVDNPFADIVHYVQNAIANLIINNVLPHRADMPVCIVLEFESVMRSQKQ